MNCKNCLHYDVCVIVETTEDKNELNDYSCNDFKDRNNYAEVRHGKWLKTKAYPHRVYCSLCYKTYVTNEEVIQGRSRGFPAYCTDAEYCPHCGAKMD